MPIRAYTSREALKNLRTSPVAKWPLRGADDDRFSKVAAPAFTPSFSFPPGATVFTIGSCFARHVEKALVLHGFDVPTTKFIPGTHDSRDADTGMLDNYGVPAIANELCWALGDEPYDPDLNLHAIHPGQFVDLHLPHRIPTCPRAEAQDRRERIFEATRSVKTADVAIMTLGLAEVWRDMETGLFLNTRPHTRTTLAFPNRFQLWVLSYDEVLAELRRAFEALRRHGRPSLKTILTVSPVPLSATFTSDDVAVANTYSKSVLRAAAQAIAATDENVDYFPSFESVTLTDREGAWLEDQVHVRPEVIEFNVRRMITAYCGVEFEAAPLSDGPGSLGKAETHADLKRAREYLAAGDHSKAMACCALVVGTPLEAHALRLQAEIHLRENRPVVAVRLAKKALQLKFNAPEFHIMLARALSAQGFHRDAAAALRRARRWAPNNGRIQAMLDDELLKAATARLGTISRTDGIPSISPEDDITCDENDSEGALTPM